MWWKRDCRESAAILGVPGSVVLRHLGRVWETVVGLGRWTRHRKEVRLLLLPISKVSGGHMSKLKSKLCCFEYYDKKIKAMRKCGKPAVFQYKYHRQLFSDHIYLTHPTKDTRSS